jgi:predicted secreted hydrolase
MRRLLLISIIALVLVAALLSWMQQRADTDSADDSRRFDLAELLGTDARGLADHAPDQGYAAVLAPRPMSFPRDHGPHPHYRSEWWYFTGNLADANGRRFGYQWVLFRLALSPDAPARQSDWGTRQAYMAHFAITDPEAGHFHAFERFARGAAGLAGARGEPLDLWLEDWSLRENPETGIWRLRARERDIEIDLELTAARPPVLQGDRGYSQKSAAPGNASHYYSISRLDTHGIHRADGRQHQVRGLSWLDREWGTSALANDQLGWDWFALQLDDGTDLMVYLLRRKDGGIDPFSAGMLISAESSTPLTADDVSVDVLAHWTSPDGVRYPARWRIDVPEHQLTLDVRPLLAGQELELSVRYWEGAVQISGRHGEAPVGGHGYVELVGYAGADRSRHR